MRARHRTSGLYYYLDTGGKPRKEIPLGTDYPMAIKKWAELTMNGARRREITFRYVAERYLREVLPMKAPRTQRDNLHELEQLFKFFDDPPAPLDDIEPLNVRQYLDWRKSAKVRANREKALFSHIWNFARNVGLTTKANPCAGIKGYKETGRDTYVDDGVFLAVWTAAEEHLRDALDLAYLTGQRPADVLKLSRDDIKDGALIVRQNKTGKLLRIAIEGQLADVVARISAKYAKSRRLLAMANGDPVSEGSLKGAFGRARSAAITAHPDLAERIREFQFRDLRAKAGTDKEESGGLDAAKDQLGHASALMTAHYVRHRKGKLVKPTK